MKADGYTHINKYESKSYNLRFRSWRWSRRTQNSPLIKNTSKKRLHVKQLSLNANQTLAERLSTTKTVRKSHMDLGRNGRGLIRSGPVPLGGDSGEIEYMGGGPPWEDLCDPMDAACQASPFSTISQSLLKFMSIKWSDFFQLLNALNFFLPQEIWAWVTVILEYSAHPTWLG